MKKMMFGLSVFAAVLFASVVFAQEKPQKNSDEKAPPRSEKMDKRGPEHREFKGNRDEWKKDEWKRDGKREEGKKEADNKADWKKGERGPEHFQDHKGQHRRPDFDQAPCERCPMKGDCPRTDYRKGDGPRQDFKAQRPGFAGHGMPFMGKDGSIEIKKIIAFFEKMDSDHDGIVTKEERADFQKKIAKKVNRDNDRRGPQADPKRGPEFDPKNCPAKKGDCPAQVKKNRKPDQNQKIQKPEMKKDIKKDHKQNQEKKAPRPEMKKDRPAPKK